MATGASTCDLAIILLDARKVQLADLNERAVINVVIAVVHKVALADFEEIIVVSTKAVAGRAVEDLRAVGLLVLTAVDILVGFGDVKQAFLEQRTLIEVLVVIDHLVGLADFIGIVVVEAGEVANGHFRDSSY